MRLSATAVVLSCAARARWCVFSLGAASRLDRPLPRNSRGSGKADGPVLHHRRRGCRLRGRGHRGFETLHRRQGIEAILYASDFLEFDAEDLRPLGERKARLAKLLGRKTRQHRLRRAHVPYPNDWMMRVASGPLSRKGQNRLIFRRVFERNGRFARRAINDVIPRSSFLQVRRQSHKIEFLLPLNTLNQVIDFAVQATL
jgi:hypothetical protein